MLTCVPSTGDGGGRQVFNSRGGGGEGGGALSKTPNRSSDGAVEIGGCFDTGTCMFSIRVCIHTCALLVAVLQNYKKPSSLIRRPCATRDTMSST